MGRHRQHHDIGFRKHLARLEATRGISDRPSNPVAMANRLVADGICTHAILGPDRSFIRAHHYGRREHAPDEIETGR